MRGYLQLGRWRSRARGLQRLHTGWDTGAWRLHTGSMVLGWQAPCTSQQAPPRAGMARSCHRRSMSRSSRARGCTYGSTSVPAERVALPVERRVVPAGRAFLPVERRVVPAERALLIVEPRVVPAGRSLPDPWRSAFRQPAARRYWAETAGKVSSRRPGVSRAPARSAALGIRCGELVGGILARSGAGLVVLLALVVAHAPSPRPSCPRPDRPSSPAAP